MDISKQLIMQYLRTQKLGRTLELYQTLPSTNTYIKFINPKELPDGFAVVADGQSGGRGQFERVFYSPAGQGVYMSVLLKPAMIPDKTADLTIKAAGAVCAAIEHTAGFTPEIKPINDIYAFGKKLCGILTETTVSHQSERVKRAIIGIGINTGKLAREVKDMAISISDITGQYTDRNILIAEVLNQLEEVYLRL